MTVIFVCRAESCPEFRVQALACQNSQDSKMKLVPWTLGRSDSLAYTAVQFANHIKTKRRTLLLMIAKSRILILIAIAAGMTISMIASPAQTGNQTKKEPAITVSCKADPDKLTSDMEAPVVTVTATVEQKEENQLTYTWSATGGAKVTGEDSVVTIDASELRPALYIVKVKVDDDKKNTATGRCTFVITQAEPKPIKECPTVSITATPQAIEAGGAPEVSLHAVAGNAGEGAKITYKWSADKGELKGEGETVTLNTASLGPGDIKVSVVGNDGKCSFTSNVTVTKK
jgi:hypothetical protein